MIFEFHPHTADIRMRIEGASFKELFGGALLGMAEILKGGTCKKAGEFDLSANLNITAKDPTCLLIDFLSEVLSLSYARHIIFCKVHVKSFSRNKLIATVYGVPMKELDKEIKAVTYHEANLVKNKKDNWETFIIFDI